MRSSGVQLVVLAGVSPWSLLGAVVHGLVLTTVLAPALLLLVRPSPGLGVLVLVATPVVATSIVYRAVAPGGFGSTRAKLLTGFALCAAFVGAFCVGIVASLLVASDGTPASPILSVVLGLLGLVALLVAAGASLDAVLVAAGSE